MVAVQQNPISLDGSADDQRVFIRGQRDAGSDTQDRASGPRDAGSDTRDRAPEPHLQVDLRRWLTQPYGGHPCLSMGPVRESGPYARSPTP